jgi:hypothetical protein
MRLDPLRMAVAALALGPKIALALFHGPPPDRARRTDAKALSRRPTRQSALNRANDTPSEVTMHASLLAGKKHESEPSRFGNLEASVRSGGGTLMAGDVATSLKPD